MLSSLHKPIRLMIAPLIFTTIVLCALEAHSESIALKCVMSDKNKKGEYRVTRFVFDDQKKTLQFQGWSKLCEDVEVSPAVISARCKIYPRSPEAFRTVNGQVVGDSYIDLYVTIDRVTLSISELYEHGDGVLFQPIPKGSKSHGTCHKIRPQLP